MKLLIVLMLASASLAQAQTRWLLATGYREDSFHTQNLAQFASDVEQSTAGALRIELRPNNSMFKLVEIRQRVQEGKVEAGESILTSMVGDIPIAGADAIPFVVQSYGDARRLWHLQRPLLERHFETRGLKALYVVPWPPQGLFTTKPVRSGSDFKGTRMRTYNQSTVRIAELLGAQPVDVPMVEVNQALASGKVDSMITSAVTGVENRVWDQIGFYYGINAWFPKNIVFVNAKAFDALPDSTRHAVTQAAARAEVRGWALSEAVANESTQELQRRGILVDRVPIAFEAELRRLGERFSREWVKSVGNEATLIFIPFYLQR